MKIVTCSLLSTQPSIKEMKRSGATFTASSNILTWVNIYISFHQILLCMSYEALYKVMLNG